MEILKKLKPSEVYFLMNRFASNENLLKFTFQSLVMEKVLKVERIKRFSHPRARRMSVFKMVSRGTQFDQLPLRSYEMDLLEVMGKDVNKEIQLRLFTRAVGSKFRKGNKTFRDDYLGNCLEFIDYYQDNFILKFLDRRTSEGKKLGKKLKSFIDLKNSELKSYQKSGDTEKILDLINTMGIHCILLKDFNDINREELKERYFMDRDYSDLQFFDSGFSDWSDSFDAFGDFGGGDFGGSGAGGEWGGGTGCSSCSGCGGCGGCS